MNARYDTYRHRPFVRELPAMRAKIAAPIFGLTRRAALRRAAARLRTARSVLITTHLTPDPDALGCHLILQLTHDLTPEEAGWLYLGIVTDTASFRFPNTNAEAHRVVADLAERGADERRLYAAMYEHVSVARMRLLGEALLGVQL